MINEKRLALLQNTMVSELCNAIDQRHPDNPLRMKTEEELFSRLPDLYDEAKEIQFGQETGQSYKFMPKQYKAMVMRLIAPEYMFSYKTYPGEFSVTVEAFLFLDFNDEKPICSGKATVPYSSASDMGEHEGKMYCESTAKGLAESKALQAYGIGSWFSYKYEPEENPDAAMDTMQKSGNLNPTIAYSETPQNAEPTSATTSAPSTSTSVEQPSDEAKVVEPQEKKENKGKQNKRSIKQQKVEIAESSESGEPEVANAAPEKEEPTEEKSDNASAGLTLDEAMAIKADCGKAMAKGYTLGETANMFPMNLAWMYVNGASERNKEAIAVIVRNNSVFQKLFADKGITID